MAYIVNFYNDSFGTITSYSWDFGLGATPAVAFTVGPHAVTYDSTGYKTVSLVVTRMSGTDSETKIDYIHVV